jgi:acyl-CoA reductase-like NAD-dependent aldehyde dehydrogenase
VLSVITVSGIEQAIAVANDTLYGLAAGIWTNNVKTAFRVAKSVRAGVVCVNCFDVGRMSMAFGGIKQSGFDRDKSLHALDKYSYVKSIWLAH